RPRSSTAASVSWNSRRAKPPSNGPRRSPKPAAARRNSASSGTTPRADWRGRSPMRTRSPFCIYFLHCHELRTGNTPKRLATSVRPNPSLHPTRYSGLRPLPRAGERTQTLNVMLLPIHRHHVLEVKEMPVIIAWSIAFALLCGLAAPVSAQTPSPASTVIQNVRIFDGTGGQLSGPSHVLVRGNRIERIASTPIVSDRRADTVLIDGGGRTLMPGLIDMHWHTM